MKPPPEIDDREETPSLRDKRLQRQRRFGIEHRLSEQFLARIARGMHGRKFSNEWRVLRWYEAEEVRDRALAVLVRKADTSEYRTRQR